MGLGALRRHPPYTQDHPGGEYVPAEEPFFEPKPKETKSHRSAALAPTKQDAKSETKAKEKE